MPGRTARGDVIDYLVGVCVKNNVTPLKTAFADFVIQACAAKFGYDKSRSKSFIDTLLSAWKHDRWTGFVRDNPYLTPQEKERWIQIYGRA
ncbi:MAG: hypothetical protein QW161_06415 [Candidatus Bathyarchaeia archaeon]